MMFHVVSSGTSHFTLSEHVVDISETRLSSLAVWIIMTRDCNAHLIYWTWAYVKQTNNTCLTFILQICSMQGN